jgi:hypothetical protein
MVGVFNKYLADGVTGVDRTGGSPDEATSTAHRRYASSTTLVSIP